jgi:hypothetical protein
VPLQQATQGVFDFQVVRLVPQQGRWRFLLASALVMLQLRCRFLEVPLMSLVVFLLCTVGHLKAAVANFRLKAAAGSHPGEICLLSVAVELVPAVT